MKIGNMAIREPIWRMLGKAERLEAVFDGGFDIFALRPDRVMVAERVRVIIMKHSTPRVNS